MRTNLQVLIGQKAQRERRRITLRSVAIEAGLTITTVYRMSNGTIREIPVDAIEKLCAFFGCEIADLLVLEDEPASPPDQA